ncbi:predicted protein [Plenodomus lingam JN3]|uniref:Predicted protein n=1 Tax=Leptosphaeria maculans (strain JN3 / isolate v23.1.3 / race Av1-4-5-6-7-8) TaxID=985895 RepID=E4ZZH8_LEPMJ|nr:predicted protein [Plenodomus lingam JN3]CBX97094.1 predicted protein [Plenodomus lingam JN3]
MRPPTPLTLTLALTPLLLVTTTTAAAAAAAAAATTNATADVNVNINVNTTANLNANANTNTTPQRFSVPVRDPTCSIDVYTETVRLVLGQYTTRRRVVYETDKAMLADEYDGVMYGFGLRWGDKGRECRARVGDMNVYYHGVARPGGVYVVDSSEEQSVNGRAAHDCLMDYFTAMLVEELGCAVNVQADRGDT